MKQKINIGIAEDHDLVRNGIAGSLKKFKNTNVLFEAKNGIELINQLKSFNPDIVLLDIKMPELDGLQAMSNMREYYPDVKIIVISAYEDREDVLDYVNRGAAAFLPKDCTIDSLVKTIVGVYKNGLFFDDDNLKTIAKEKLFKPRELTERELEALKLFCENKSYELIAKEMGITVGTAEWYKQKLIHKTRTKDLTGLLNYALEHNLLK